VPVERRAPLGAGRDGGLGPEVVGHVERGDLGAGAQALSPDLAVPLEPDAVAELLTGAEALAVEAQEPLGVLPAASTGRRNAPTTAWSASRA
jgi:hypothetical protein